MHSADEALAPAVLASQPGELSIQWRSETFMVMDGKAPDPSELEIDTGAVLMFSLAEQDVAKRLDYLDIEALWASVERPGRYRIVNCACGYASCADVDSGIDVLHPDADIVVWDIDVQGMAGVFPRPSPWGEQPGIVRLTFARADYERAVREFARAMRFRASAPLRWESIGHVSMQSIENVRAEFPTLDAVPIGLWLPEGDGEALERLLAMNPEAPFQRGRPPLS
jgi:hypothetical protein